MFVSDGTRCFTCWDEEDNSCETDFLANHRSWRTAEERSCAQAPHDDSSSVFEHLTGGRKVQVVDPGARRLTPTIDFVSVGPYAPGDKVIVVAAARDDNGDLRKVDGGNIVVDDGRGGRTKVRAKVRPDGTVTAEITLPAMMSITLEFEPEFGHLRATERPGQPAPRRLTIETCTLRAAVASPAPWTAVAEGDHVGLQAQLFDRQNQKLTAVPPDLALEFHVNVDGVKAAVSLPADAHLQATWAPPSVKVATQVGVSVSGHAGLQTVCPLGAELSLQLTSFGIGLDRVGLPSHCYTGRACRSEIRLLRPLSGAASRARVDALLADPATEVVLRDNGREVAHFRPAADDRYRYAPVYDDAAAGHQITLEIRTPAKTLAIDAFAFDVAPPLHLVLPPQIDFGSLQAGTATLDQDHCQPLDFGRSTAYAHHEFKLTLEADAGCVAHPRLVTRISGGEISDLQPLPADLDALDPRDPPLALCLEVPRCAGETSPQGLALHVVPRAQEFVDQAAVVRLRWQVQGRPWYLCHGWWLWPLTSILGAGIALLGYARPARFSPSASIRVSGKEDGIKRAAAIVLVECTGSSAGFFRDAALGLLADGTLTGKTRGAPVVLRATHEGLVLVSTALDVRGRQKLTWKPVDDGLRGHPPAPNMLYRAGGTFFQVDPGV
jgi:hypothetical protein